MDNFDSDRFANLEIDDEPAPPSRAQVLVRQDHPQGVIEYMRCLLALCSLPQPALVPPLALRTSTPPSVDARQTEMFSRSAAPVSAVPALVTTSRDLVAVEDRSESTGSIVYWSVGGHVSREKLIEELPPGEFFPSVCSPETALKRAVQALRERGVFLRPHPRGGYAIVRERMDRGELVFDVAARAYLVDRRLEFNGFLPEADVDTIRGEFARAQTDLSAQDLSSWLLHLMDLVGAVGLRPTGGVYFVPRARVARIQACRDALEKVAPQCRVHEIPALRSAEVVRAVLEAAIAEFVQVMDHIEAEFAGDLGPRAAGTRLEKLAAAERKAQDYARLSGQPVASVQSERLSQLREKLLTLTSRTSLLEVG